MMSELVIKYKHDKWGNNGPVRVAGMINLCKTTRDLHCDHVIIMPMEGSEIFEYQNVVWRFKSEDSNSWTLAQHDFREKMFFFHWFNHMWHLDNG